MKSCYELEYYYTKGNVEEGWEALVWVINYVREERKQWNHCFNLPCGTISSLSLVQ